MKKRIFLFILLLLTIDVKAQTYEEKYNLNFRVGQVFHGWINNINNSKIYHKADTTDTRKPIRFLQKELWGFREKMDMNLYSSRMLLLPALSNPSLKVSISYKCKNLETARLFVYSLNKQMEVIKTDSICLKNAADFRTDGMEIGTKDLYFLSFRLQAVGTDSTYTTRVASCGPEGCTEQENPSKIAKVRNTIPHEISIFRIELKDGDKMINALEFEDIPSPNFSKAQLVTLSPDYSLTQKQLSLMSGKITALGEAVHGSEKIRQATSEYIKSAILRNHTTLILWERPLLMSLFFNRYVQGSDLISPEKLQQVGDSTSVRVENIELAKWIREYNKTATEKVSFLGNDAQYEANELATYLKDYLQIINQEARSVVLDSMISAIQMVETEGIKDMARKVLCIIQENRAQLTDILGNDIEIISFYINNLLEAPISTKNSYYERDEQMFKNTVFLTALFCRGNQRAVISCHLGHANYQTVYSPLYKSFGHYMKDYFKDDYVCVAQTVCEDSAKVINGRSFEPKELSAPARNSIEETFMKFGVNYGYVDAKNLDEIIKIRIQGAHHLPASETDCYIHPKSQIQGILLID